MFYRYLPGTYSCLIIFKHYLPLTGWLMHSLFCAILTLQSSKHSSLLLCTIHTLPHYLFTSFITVYIACIILYCIFVFSSYLPEKNEVCLPTTSATPANSHSCTKLLTVEQHHIPRLAKYRYIKAYSSIFLEVKASLLSEILNSIQSDHPTIHHNTFRKQYHHAL